MRHVLVPLHILHATVWFTAYQAGVAIVSHVNSVIRWNDERGRKLGLLNGHTPHTANATNSTPLGSKLDVADGKPDAVDGKFDGFWRIFTLTERSCIFSVTSGLTHGPNMDLCRHIYYAQLITYSWLCKSLMNIHDDSATSDVTSLGGCDVTQQRGFRIKRARLYSFVFLYVSIYFMTEPESSSYNFGIWICWYILFQISISINIFHLQ